MILANGSTLSREEIQQVFRRTPGAAAALARDLGISRQNITDWMNGFGRSKRVDSAIRQRASELLVQEQAKQEGSRE